jgi:hypothetical protein
MQLGGRVLAILFAVAGLMVIAPAPARATQNCALNRTGDVYCYGPGAPVRVPVTGKVVQLAASGDSTCALTEPGEVYCWSADAAPPPTDGGLGLSPLLLIAVGMLLVGGGVTLVFVSRPAQGARFRAASRNLPAPALSRSV